MTSETPLQSAIRAHLAETGKSERGLSLEVGRSEKLISHILSGRSQSPRGVTLVRIAKVLQVPLAALVGNQLELPSPDPLATNVWPAPPNHPMPWPRVQGPVDVPVYGVAEAGEEGFFEVNITDGPIDRIERPPALANTRRCFAFFVSGTSMEPVWISGDPVYVAPEWPKHPGHFVLATVERRKGDQPLSFVKQFVRRDDHEVILRQFNPYQEVAIEARRVKEVWRALHWRELGHI